jgi:hypothetical protein
LGIRKEKEKKVRRLFPPQAAAMALAPQPGREGKKNTRGVWTGHNVRTRGGAGKGQYRRKREVDGVVGSGERWGEGGGGGQSGEELLLASYGGEGGRGAKRRARRAGAAARAVGEGEAGRGSNGGHRGTRTQKRVRCWLSCPIPVFLFAKLVGETCLFGTQERKKSGKRSRSMLLRRGGAAQPRKKKKRGGRGRRRSLLSFLLELSRLLEAR